jgi:hypothetical protein
MRLLTALAFAAMALHLAVVSQYDIFRDEFYYLACGRHLAWGYVDHPPVVAVMGRAAELLGGSIFAIRLLPILLSGVLVFLVGAIVRRLGGGRFAQVLAAVLVTLSPHFLFIFHILSMNSAEVVLWALGAWLVLVALDTGAAWPWLAFGVTAGVGLLTKHSMGVFGLGIFAGLVLTPARQSLRTPWPWIGGLIAALVFAPHLWWQHTHGWPTAEFVRNAQEFKITEQSVGSFLGQLALMMSPITLPLWLAGLWWLMAGRASDRGRVLAVCAVVVVLVFVVQRSKPYYATAVMPVLLAAGAVALERATAQRRFARNGAAIVLVLGAIPIVPMGLPLLPVETFIRYTAGLGLIPANQERQELGALPQHFADMHGWEDLAREVSRVYQQLPADERATARVFAQNYGEAGALEYFALRGRYPLPRVISPHNNYWYWGPGDDGGTLIVIGGRREDMEAAFEHVEDAGRTSCRYCMPYENNQVIRIGRGWKVGLGDVWIRERRFI